MDEAERLSQALAQSGIDPEQFDPGLVSESVGSADPDNLVDTQAQPQELQGLSPDEIRQLRDALEDQKSRNSGLQRKLQPTLRENELLRQRLANIEEQLMASQLAALPPEEAQARMAQYRYQRETEAQTRQQQQTQALLEQQARALTVKMLSDDWQVPADTLNLVKSPDPDDMELIAVQTSPYEARRVADPETGLVRWEVLRDAQGNKVLKQGRAPQANPQVARPGTPAPRFESGSGSVVPPPKAKDLDEASELFVRLARQRNLYS